MLNGQIHFCLAKIIHAHVLKDDSEKKSPHLCSLATQFPSQEATTTSTQMQKFGFNIPC